MTIRLQKIQTAHRADAEQAAYLRAELETQRALLEASIGKRKAIIERPGDVGHTRLSLTSTEEQLRHIDWMIARLASRFALHADVNR